MARKGSREAWFLFVLSYPLTSEVVRRFIFYSDYIFIVGDALILSTLLLIWRSVGKTVYLGRFFYFAGSLLLLYGTATCLTHGNFMIALVGARAIFIPFCYLMLSAYYIQRYPGSRRTMFGAVSAWSAIVSLIAILQIALGADNPINILPAAANATGIGDFTVESQGLGLVYLFRPTSIFMHTGKFGQAIFTLVLFKWIILWMNPSYRSRAAIASIPLDIVGIILSGERASYVFLTLSIGGIFIYRGLSAPQRLVRQLIGTLAILSAVASIALLLAPHDLAELVVARYVSGFQDIPLRLRENLLLPAERIVSLYGLGGEGMGFFTLGSTRFGGQVLYEFIYTAGLGEDSWLRLLAELGVAGAALYLMMFINLFFCLRRNLMRHSDRVVAAAYLFAICWLLSIGAWAITHDVFANSVGMSLGFVLCGAAFTRGAAPLEAARGNSEEVSWDGGVAMPVE